jgi:maleylacetoacetate isomerase
MATKAILFSSWRSSCSYRVRICLNFKEIPYSIKPVSLLGLGNGEDGDNERELKENNPMRYVPALKIDGHTLIESQAIMQYLEETRPEIPMLPQDPFKKSQVRAICDIIVAGIQPLQNIGVLNHMGHFMGEKEKVWSQHWINRGFKAIETLLDSTAGKFCVGDDVSLADCCLVPQVFNARR